MAHVRSLFSGVGGLDLGLERAGWEHVYLCEKHAWRRRVLKRRFPGVPIYGATAELGGDECPNFAADLLCGGFPCKDLSVVGRRAGIRGDASSLFFEFTRLTDAIRPRWLLLENVPGLLWSPGRDRETGVDRNGADFGVVLHTLAECGYGVAWRVVDSRYFGVPQRRRRVFIVGSRIDGDPRAAAERAGEILAVGSRCARHSDEGRETGEDVAAVLEGSPGLSSRLAGTFGSITGGFRTTDIDTVGAYAVSVSENQRAEVLETPYVRQLTTGGGKPGQGYPTVRLGMQVRRLTPRECERLQGLPDDWTAATDDATDTARYAAIGDAVSVPVAEWIGRRLRAAHER